jgi:flagellar protein FlgJ
MNIIKKIISLVSSIFVIKTTVHGVMPVKVEEVRPMKKIITMSKLPHVQSFVSFMAPIALKVEDETGIRALAMLGQVAQETGWGVHILRADENGIRIQTNNLFNIKVHSGWTGRVASRDVWEVVNGANVTEKSYFRVYENYEDSFRDYINYIMTRKMPDGRLRYKEAIENKSDWEKYLIAIAKAGYATAPAYAQQCIMCVKNYMIEICNPYSNI